MKVPPAVIGPPQVPDWPDHREEVARDGMFVVGTDEDGQPITANLFVEHRVAVVWRTMMCGSEARAMVLVQTYEFDEHPDAVRDDLRRALARIDHDLATA